ncbi:hypothetical protein FRC11_014596 [Ceratobasidium sp. 423]|nr:hypothetical protein FRC11_014596 [Ceratobasidium sp. 423]
MEAYLRQNREGKEMEQCQSEYEAAVRTEYERQHEPGLHQHRATPALIPSTAPSQAPEQTPGAIEPQPEPEESQKTPTEGGGKDNRLGVGETGWDGGGARTRANSPQPETNTTEVAGVEVDLLAVPLPEDSGVNDEDMDKAELPPDAIIPEELPTADLPPAFGEPPAVADPTVNQTKPTALLNVECSTSFE